MARVGWSDDALDDLEAIVSYIDQFNPAAALDYRAALVTLGNSLINFPNRGRPAIRGTREMTSVPPYILAYRYREEDDEVDILPIRHGRRQPRA